MKLLFLFVDGVGLGADDREINPLARAVMPNLHALLGGSRLLEETAPFDGTRASLRALDANLGVSGLPQSATGQATLLTGINVPREIGYHYGPKPNPAVAEFLRNGTLFSRVSQSGKRVGFLNAYPPRYFDAIQSGRRMYSAIPMAVASALIPLRTAADLYTGQAMSADLTGEGWRSHLGMTDAPILPPRQAGQRLAELTTAYDLAFFEYWLSDYAGHGQDMGAACTLLETFDSVLGGLVESWDDSNGLALITSDHGNLENLGTRRHTDNPVPAVIIGSAEARQTFTKGLHDLTGIAPAILRHLGVDGT